MVGASSGVVERAVTFFFVLAGVYLALMVASVGLSGEVYDDYDDE